MTGPDGEPLHCGWPFPLANTRTVVFCGLPLCHDGPWCRVLDGDGTTVAATHRFAMPGVKRPHPPGAGGAR